MAKELPARQEIDNQYKWNLESIYQSDENWEKDFKKVKEMLNQVDDYKGQLVSTSKKLFEGIELILKIKKIVSRIYAYSHMRYDEDTGNQTYQVIYNKAQSLYNDVNSAISFMVPEIVSLSKEDMERFIEEKEELQLYRHLLEDIMRKKDYFLSAQEEKLLAMAGDLAQGPENIFGILINADLSFPTIEDEKKEEVRVTHGRYKKFMQNKDRRVRKDAFNALYSKYDEFSNTFASILNASVKGNIFYAKARNYNSALEAALHDENVPVDVYNNLISTVRDNIDAMYQYVSLRKKVLGFDNLHMYDVYVPLIKDLDLKISYSEAKDTVLKGIAYLGDEYSSIIQEGYNSGWIDVYENKGKRSGAYSSGCYGVHPYVLLNHTDNLDSMFTLAHEMGHALHTYYSNQNQPFVYANYKIFVAEVASTLNEILLLYYLLQNTDDDLKKKYLINHYLDQFRGTIFRQTMFAEFEKIIHEEAEKGTPLTSEFLKEKYRQLNIDYFGPDIIIDEQIDLEWALIPHFYYNFYVYKYATGFSAATALANKILQEGEVAVKKYIDFLKSGDSDYPLNLLKIAGVDMTSSDPIKTAIDTFKNFLKDFEELL